MYIDLCYVQPAVRAQMTVQQVMHDIVKLRKPIVDTTVIIPSSGVVNGVEFENGPVPSAVSA